MKGVLHISPHFVDRVSCKDSW